MELFRSADVAVRASGPPGADRWVVLFDNYGHDRDLDRAGFGEAFFGPRGIAHVTVLGRDNSWYQYPEMAAALAAVRAHVAGAGSVMTYGSSMGAYAALRHAGSVGATAVLALSPQYTIDPARVPWENRWPQEARAIRWLPGSAAPLAPGCVPVVAHDAFGPDARHARLIAADCPIRAIPIPFGDHPVATLLLSTGLLERLVLATLDGTIDAPAFTAEARRRSRGDLIYLSCAARSQPAWRRGIAVRLASHALTVAPEGIATRHAMGKALVDAGRPAEALPYFASLMADEAITPENRQASYGIPYAEALFAAGQRAAARTLADAVGAALPELAHVQHWHAWMAWRGGDRRAARRIIAGALALDPDSPPIRDAHARWTAPARSWLGRLLRR